MHMTVQLKACSLPSITDMPDPGRRATMRAPDFMDRRETTMADASPPRHARPFVSMTAKTKQLHFVADEVQSSMDLRDPSALNLEYTRAMMGFLLFDAAPAQVGMIGLGGGSLAKFCYRHLPDSMIRIAEINPYVIALRDEFEVPEDDERFSIVEADGADFVRNCPASFNVLLVDGYDARGLMALLEARRHGLWERQHWLPNIVAGIVVGVVALPLAMAFAIASGAKPEQGLYTAIIAGWPGVGAGRQPPADRRSDRGVHRHPLRHHRQIRCRRPADRHADGRRDADGAGLARLGSIIKFIPDPVIVGFTAGIGVIIWVGQWKDFFGLPAVSGEHFHQKLWHLLQALPQLHPVTTALSLLSLALVIFTPRLPGLKKVPGPLVALVAATLLQSLCGFDGVATIGSAFGGIPQGCRPSTCRTSRCRG
jgi:hypothetical protein